jgi:uncharacterized protein (DUF488 family)
LNTTIFTLGHSTHSMDEFLAILAAFNIELVADVRTIPRSRHNPQFNRDDLKNGLEIHGLGYLHLEGLGGLRHSRANSLNLAWKNSSFRGYADYMQTPEFVKSLEQLIALAREKTTVIMCAEAVPWRCHRSLIGDALLVRAFTVRDILNAKTSRPHQMTPWAKVEGHTLTYPGEEQPDNPG